MLDEDFELGDDWAENEDCGCVIAKGDFGDGITEVHHWIPDDTAPHVPDADCGCGPVLRSDAKGVILFEHHDQDDMDVSKLKAVG